MGEIAASAPFNSRRVRAWSGVTGPEQPSALRSCTPPELVEARSFPFPELVEGRSAPARPIHAPARSPQTNRSVARAGAGRCISLPSIGLDHG